MTSVRDAGGVSTVDPDADLRLPPRRRRRRLGAGGTLAAGLLAAGIGLLAGIELEKPHVASSGATAAGRSAPDAFRLRIARAGFGAAGASGLTTGTVIRASGASVVVRESSGATVTVHILPTSTVTKATTVGRAAIEPGDSVTLTGHADTGANYTATAVTDAGASS